MRLCKACGYREDASEAAACPNCEQAMEVHLIEASVQPTVKDLAALVRRLSRPRVSEDTKAKAIEYLRRYGLEGSILRAEM